MVLGMSILDSTLAVGERAALDELVRRVRARYGDRVRKIAFFGSRARGDVTEESDIDVAIVLAGQVGLRERSDINGIAWDVVLALPAPVELSPRTLGEREYRRLVDEEWRIGLDIEREGVPL